MVLLSPLNADGKQPGMASVITPFAEIRQRAAERKGGEKELAALVSGGLKSPKLLAKVDDSRYLSAMTSAVFKAGFVWKIIDHKWPGFEKAFWHFNVLRCAMMSPDDFDTLCGDERIVRNPQKIRTVPLNAAMILDVQKSHGSFGRFLAAWPQDDFVGLLDFLDFNCRVTRFRHILVNTRSDSCQQSHA